MEQIKRQKLNEPAIIQTQKPKTINMVKQDIINEEIDINRCVECGIDLGDCNPRQYCAKTYCYQSY